MTSDSYTFYFGQVRIWPAFLGIIQSSCGNPFDTTSLLFYLVIDLVQNGRNPNDSHNMFA